ncbi:MAG: HAD family hydrolase [Chloroflexi bacterium]|nr:MAG: HAD family hydrolase [Chloroflexota bacterium]
MYNLIMQPAIFMDRDGVIIENRENYVLSLKDVSIYPFTFQALASIRSSLYKIILITNQSAVGRGLLSLDEAQGINLRLVELIRLEGGRIDAVYMCPHAPSDVCSCRKPEPGLFFQAAEEMGIDLANSIMIGDALTDLLAAERAGIPKTALVMTGRGLEQSALPLPPGMKPFKVFDNLEDALKGMLCFGS